MSLHTPCPCTQMLIPWVHSPHHEFWCPTLLWKLAALHPSTPSYSDNSVCI